jgi:FSR family fosmidomycin resistance protein-like MFS transporter
VTAASSSPAAREREVIALVGFAHGVSHFFHLLIPPLFPWLKDEFSLSYTQLGLTTTVFFVVSGAGQALAGFVVDHVGARRVLFGGIALFALAAMTLGMAYNYPMILLAAALAGAGNSVFHPVDFTLLNRNVTSIRLGHAFSIHGLSGNLGWALAPVSLTAIAAAISWHAAAFAAAGLAVLAGVLLFIRRETLNDLNVHPEHAASAAAANTSSTFAFLGSRAVWMCFGFFLLTTMAFGVLQNYGPSILQHMYDVSVALGATALTAFLLGGAAGIAAGGFLAARGDAHDRYIAIGLATAALFALLIASGAVPAWSIVPLMAAMGFCSGIAGPSRDLLVRRAATSRFGHRAFGRVYGFVYSGLDTGFALALLFGPLMDAKRFALVLMGVAVLWGLAVTMALRVGRSIAVVDPVS